MPATDMPMNLEEVLDGMRFPAAKVQILVHAGDHGASTDAMAVLQALPVRNYNNIQDINAELGKIDPLPGQDNLWSSRGNKEQGQL